MLKQKTTILLLGLICFSSVSGFLTVNCHGSDGHIALEPVGHSHCECPEESLQTSSPDKLPETSIGSKPNHDHCKDFLAISSVILPEKKKNGLSIHKVNSANLVVKLFSSHTTSFFRYATVQSHELSSFYTPLRSIILLA